MSREIPRGTVRAKGESRRGSSSKRVRFPARGPAAAPETQALFTARRSSAESNLRGEATAVKTRPANVTLYTREADRASSYASCRPPSRASRFFSRSVIARSIKLKGDRGRDTSRVPPPERAVRATEILSADHPAAVPKCAVPHPGAAKIAPSSREPS